MLDVVTALADGRRITVDGTVTNVVRKLREGDPILGWDGDDSMRVMVDLDTGTFDVWALDAAGNPYLCLSRPYCDERLVLDVARNRRNPLSKRLAEREANKAKREDWEREQRIGDLADRLHFALHLDLGHHEGLRRRNLLHTIRPTRKAAK